jgi:hypothetical protein
VATCRIRERNGTVLGLTQKPGLRTSSLDFQPSFQNQKPGFVSQLCVSPVFLCRTASRNWSDDLGQRFCRPICGGIFLAQLHQNPVAFNTGFFDGDSSPINYPSEGLQQLPEKRAGIAEILC